MKAIITVARKEIRSAFVTPIAYVALAGFLLIAGFFFFTLLNQYNSVLAQAALIPTVTPNLNEWVVFPYYQTLEIVLIFLIPILTMRSIAEEKNQGTFELLATSPIQVHDIVYGKICGLFVVVTIMLCLSFVFPFVLILFADPEVLPIYVGFLGILFFGLAFTSLGVAVSAFTRNQTVAGVVSLVLFLLFFVIDAPAAKLEGVMADVLNYLAPARQAEVFLKGVIDGSAMIYFLSVIAVGIFVAHRALEAQRVR